MVSPRLRSGTLRKVKRKTPGNRVSVQYKPRKPSQSRCAGCGSKLSGVPRLRPIILSKLPKSQKRPERPFGGVLCSRCMRELIKIEARSNANP